MSVLNPITHRHWPEVVVYWVLVAAVTCLLLLITLVCVMLAPGKTR